MDMQKTNRPRQKAQKHSYVTISIHYLYLNTPFFQSAKKCPCGTSHVLMYPVSPSVPSFPCSQSLRFVGGPRRKRSYLLRLAVSSTPTLMLDDASGEQGLVQMIPLSPSQLAFNNCSWTSLPKCSCHCLERLNDYKIFKPVLS